MGDRANILFHDAPRDRHPQDGVYLYTHWHGTELSRLLAQGLHAARNRWDDPAYCTRIVIDTILTITDQHDTETGWGISTSIQDNEHPILVVNYAEQRVYSVAETSMLRTAIKGMTFEDFTNQP